MTWSNGGNCNIHATVGPITWKPHYRLVEYQSWFNVLSITGGECKRWAMCLSKDLNEIFRRYQSRCVCPPPPVCFGQKRLTTAPHRKIFIMYRYEAPLWKRQLSVVYFVSFPQVYFIFWVQFLFRPKSNHSQLYRLYFRDCLLKPHAMWEETTGNTSHWYWANEPTGRHLFHDILKQGRWHCEL